MVPTIVSAPASFTSFRPFLAVPRLPIATPRSPRQVNVEIHDLEDLLAVESEGQPVFSQQVMTEGGAILYEKPSEPTLCYVDI